MNFREFYQLFSEAISLKNVKKKGLRRKQSGAYNIPILNEVFKEKDRLIYPVEIEDLGTITKENPLVEKIFKKINDNFNMTIRTRKDYVAGVVFKLLDNERKQPYKIGKLLNKLANNGDKEAKELLEAFRDDPERNAKNLNKFYIIISRHPYDLAGMSTDRNWSSCMNLGLKGIIYKGKREPGINARYVQRDINAGSIVAYLVSDEDRHSNGKLALRKPLSRILMKPFENDDNPKEKVFSRGRTYGITNQIFIDFITDWLTKNTNVNTEGKSYSMSKNLYDDADSAVNFKKGKKKSDALQVAFFNELGYSPTDEKYFNKFTVNETHNYYNDSRGFELQIRFDLPPDAIKLHSFEYSYNETKPPFVKEMVKSLYLKNGLPNSNSQVSSDTDNDNNAVIIEYMFSGREYYEDPKYELDEDQEIEEWEYLIKESIEMRKLNYKEARKNILAVLSNFNLDEEKKKEENSVNEYFREYTQKPFIKNVVNGIFDNIPHALKCINELISVANNSQNPLISLYEFIINNPHLEEFLREFKNDYTKFYRSFWSNLPSGIDYHFISFRTQWDKLVRNYAKVDYLESNLFKPAEHALRPAQIMIQSKPAKFHQIATEFEEKYGKDNLSDLYDWLESLGNRIFNSRMAEVLPLRRSNKS